MIMKLCTVIELGNMWQNLKSKGDVEFDLKNRNSSIAFLFMKSKCANLACVLLDQ